MVALSNKDLGYCQQIDREKDYRIWENPDNEAKKQYLTE